MTGPHAWQHALDRGCYADVFTRASAVPPDDPQYAAARLVAVRAELARGRVVEAADILEDSADPAFNGEDGRILNLWRIYLLAYRLPDAQRDPLGNVVAQLDRVAGRHRRRRSPA